MSKCTKCNREVRIKGKQLCFVCEYNELTEHPQTRWEIIELKFPEPPDENIYKAFLQALDDSIRKAFYLGKFIPPENEDE